MTERFWVFECTFVVNNNFLMGEVFVCATRKELLAAMSTFFATPRANVLLAEVAGAYWVEDGKAEDYFDAMPFLAVQIAQETLAFDRESLEHVVGDLGGDGISRRYLAKGRAIAVDAEEEDKEDNEGLVLVPFTLHFDAAAFLASLPARDGELIASGAELVLVRPLAAPGWPEHFDEDMFGEPVKVTPGWWDAEPADTPKRFDPGQRFVSNYDVPIT